MRDYKLYTIYIGGDNETGLVDQGLAILTLEKYFASYTFTLCNGIWGRKSEQCMRVEVASDLYSPIVEAIEALKVALDQSCILLSVSAGEVKFI